MDSLDDLLLDTYKQILSDGEDVSGKRGGIREIRNYVRTLDNPRSRISQSLNRQLVRSKFAELAWYLSQEAERDYILPYLKAYSEEESENNKILGGYGPKIFAQRHSGLSQFERVIQQISKRKHSKQAYISISDAADYRVRSGKFSSPPCTIGLHFLVRNGQLHLTTYMRSNDAYYGLPHDLFCFTMFQEIVSLLTKTTIGTYTHVCTSMHIYESQLRRVERYIQEGYQDVIKMPEMKTFDWEIADYIVDAFDTKTSNATNETIDDYWHDFALFGKTQSNPLDDTWLNKFKLSKFRRIAANSITN